MFKKILCPVDLSPKSAVALERAVELAKMCATGLTLLHVHEEFMDKHEMVMLRINVDHFKDIQAERAKASKSRMREMVAGVGGEGLEVKLLLREGKPYHEIVETADKEGADLIVMATDGRTGLGQLILGSNTERVVHHAPCSVLAIRQ